MDARRVQRLVGIGLVAAVAVAMTVTISVAQEEDATRSPDVLAYALGFAVAALLLMRHRSPMGALVASVGVLMVYYSLEYPAFSPAVPLAAAAFFAAVAGHLLAASVLLAGMVLFGLGWQTLGEHTSLFSVLGTNTIADTALLAAVLLLGEAVRSRRAWAAEVRARLARVDAEREREAERRVQEERLRIARELHDVMAHTIAGIGVQAGVAADVLDDAPDDARSSLGAIRAQTRAATAELRAAVGVLRDGDPDAPRAPSPGLHALEALVDAAGRGGLEVDVAVAGEARTLPGAVDLTAYRIVQEALTNVVRHAHASEARVVVRYEPEEVVVAVADDGRGAGARDEVAAIAGRNGAAGYGLVGMRERVAAIGGTLDAGPAPSGGFRVAARLPARSSSS